MSDEPLMEASEEATQRRDSLSSSFTYTDSMEAPEEPTQDRVTVAIVNCTAVMLGAVPSIGLLCYYWLLPHWGQDCAVDDVRPYTGCGALYWWAPLYSVLMVIAAVVWFGFRKVMIRGPEVRHRPPNQIIVRNSRRATLNGDYTLQHDCDKPRPSWEKSQFRVLLDSDETDWLFFEGGEFVAHSLRHHRGRWPNQYDAKWCTKQVNEEVLLLDPDVKIAGIDASRARLDSRHTAWEYHNTSSFFRPILYQASKWCVLGFGLPVFALWYKYGRSLKMTSYAIPPVTGASPFGDCPCVLLNRSVILPPMQYSVLGVAILFIVNTLGKQASEVVKSWWRGHPTAQPTLARCESPAFNMATFIEGSNGQRGSSGIGNRLSHMIAWCTTGVSAVTGYVMPQTVIDWGNMSWYAIGRPSMLFSVIPSLILNCIHLPVLLYHMPADLTIFEAYLYIYGNVMNSGAMTFYVTAVYGSLITLAYFDRNAIGATAERDLPHYSTGAGLRIIGGWCFFFIMIPPFLSHTMRGAIKYFWFAIPCEILFSLSFEVFFPESSETAFAFIYRRRTLMGSDFSKNKSSFFSWDTLKQVCVLCSAIFVLPLHEPMAWVTQRIGISQRKSPVDPWLRTFLVGVFCVMKSLELSFFFDLAFLGDLDVGYLDCIPLAAVNSRHMACTPCIMALSAEQVEASGQNIVAECVMKLGTLLY